MNIGKVTQTTATIASLLLHVSWTSFPDLWLFMHCPCLQTELPSHSLSRTQLLGEVYGVERLVSGNDECVVILGDCVAIVWQLWLRRTQASPAEQSVSLVQGHTLLQVQRPRQHFEFLPWHWLSSWHLICEWTLQMKEIKPSETHQIRVISVASSWRAERTTASGVLLFTRKYYLTLGGSCYSSWLYLLPHSAYAQDSSRGWDGAICDSGFLLR